MIDRNDFDQRIAAHTSKVARINEQGWQQGQASHRPIRGAMAAALLALAARLVPERATRQTGQPGQRPATA